MLNSKLSKILYLLFGAVCLALAKGDWPMVLPGFLFPYFLLRYTRNEHSFSSFLWLYLAIYVAVFFGVYKRMSFFPKSFFLIMTAIYAFQVIFQLLLERFFYYRAKGFIQCLIYPLLITSWEFLSCIISGGTWSTLGFSQLDNPVLMQAASLFGLFFITFGVAFGGSFLNWLQDQNWNWLQIRKPIIITLSIAGALLWYGNIELKQTISKETTRVAGIFTKTDQASIDYSELDYDYWKQRLSPREKIENGLSKTRKAVAAGAQIVAWAEAYLFIDELQQEYVLQELKQIATENRVYLLASYLMLKDKNRPGRLMENKAVMIAPQGMEGFHYRKSFLVNGIENLIIDPGTKDIPVIDTPYGRVGAVICYDMMFPQLTKQMSKKKIDLLLVPGHDWQGVTPLATQVSAVAALENRTALLRVTTDGLSAAYDSYGRCLGQINAFVTKQDIFICDIPVQRSVSFYGVVGWIFPYLVLVLTGLLLGWRLLRQMAAWIIHLAKNRAATVKREG